MKHEAILREAKDGEIVVQRSYRDCRKCKHFCRVRELNGSHQVRGFCEKGEGLNDFGLFVSSSRAAECELFDFDESKAGLVDDEDEYTARKERYAESFGKQMSKALRAAKQKKKVKDPYDWFFADIALVSEGRKDFDQKHFEEFVGLCRRADIDEKQYLKLRDSIKELVKRFLLVEKVRHKNGRA